MQKLYLYADKKIITRKDVVQNCKRIMIRPGENANPEFALSSTEARKIIDTICKPVKVIFMDFVNDDTSFLIPIITSSKIKGIIIFNSTSTFIISLISHINNTNVTIKTVSFEYKNNNNLIFLPSIVDYISKLDSDLKFGFKFKDTNMTSYTRILNEILTIKTLYKLYIDGGTRTTIPAAFVTSLTEHPNLSKISLPRWVSIGPSLILKLMLKPNLKTCKFSHLLCASRPAVAAYCETLFKSSIEKLTITYDSDLNQYILSLLLEAINEHLLKMKIRQPFMTTTFPIDNIENRGMDEKIATMIINKLQANINNKYRRESSLTKLCSDHIHKHGDEQTITTYSEVLLV